MMRKLEYNFFEKVKDYNILLYSYVLTCFWSSGSSYTHTQQHKHTAPERWHALTLKRVLRRSVLQFLGLSPILLNVCTVTAAPMQEMKEPDVIR